MITEEWLRAGVADEMAELRELPFLMQDHRFSDFFSLPIGSISSDGSAIVGRSGYLFVNDGSNRWREQLRGTLSIDERALSKTVAFLLDAKDRCQRLGIAFRLCVFPEKDIIHSELSPNVSGLPSGSRPVFRLIEAATGIDIVYPVAQLQEHCGIVRCYHPRNSHTSFFGGMLMVNQLLESLGKGSTSLRLTDTEHVYWPDDLSIKWVQALNTRRRSIRRTYHANEIVKSDRHTGKYIEYSNNEAHFSETIVVFGDSYAWNPDAGLVPFLTADYQKVHFKWQNKIEWEFVEKVRPRVLVLESAERFLIRGLF